MPEWVPAFIGLYALLLTFVLGIVGKLVFEQLKDLKKNDTDYGVRLNKLELEQGKLMVKVMETDAHIAEKLETLTRKVDQLIAENAKQQQHILDFYRKYDVNKIERK